MKKIYKLVPCMFSLILNLCAHNAQAMEWPEEALNERIAQALEDIIKNTPTLSEEEKLQLSELITLVSYSNVPVMTKEDFERFFKNYLSIMNRCEKYRAWYIKYLRPYLNEDETLLIDVQWTPKETLDWFTSNQQYFNKKIFPVLAIPLIELSFYTELQNAWKNGGDGHGIMGKYLELHTLWFMCYGTENQQTRAIAGLGLFTFELRRLSYEQWQTLGQLYKEAFHTVLGWFYKKLGV